jgi:hypothetical protein
MFKRLSSALLTAIALGSPVTANELEKYIYSNPVLAEVHKSGTTIRFVDPSCNNRIYGSYTPKTDVMVLCLDNHPDFAELGNTIRHETVHIIQTCIGGPVMSFEQVASYAKPQDYKAMRTYGTHSHHHELEANIAARSMTDMQIVSSFKDACYENN